MWNNDTLYVSVDIAAQIFMEEKLVFGDRKHIAAKHRLAMIRGNSKAYERNLLARVRSFLRDKYGAKYERHSGSFEIQ